MGRQGARAGGVCGHGAGLGAHSESAKKNGPRLENRANKPQIPNQLEVATNGKYGGDYHERIDAESQYFGLDVSKR